MARGYSNPHVLFTSPDILLIFSGALQKMEGKYVSQPKSPEFRRSDGVGSKDCGCHPPRPPRFRTTAFSSIWAEGNGTVVTNPSGATWALASWALISMRSAMSGFKSPLVDTDSRGNTRSAQSVSAPGSNHVPLTGSARSRREPGKHP